MTCRLVALLGAAALVAGCGGDEMPSAPSTTTATVTTLTIAGNEAILTGGSAIYTATAQLSDGTTRQVTPAWTSSDPSVAALSVTTVGRLAGLTHGSVNLAASYQGQSASKDVHIVQNYGGDWSGTYVVDACDQSGVFADVDWCDTTGVGSRYPFSLSVIQGENINAHDIRGIVSFYELAGTISGHVTGDGRLEIGGSYSVTDPEDGVTITIQVGGWDTRLAVDYAMSGGWALNVSANGVAGNAYERHHIVSAARESLTVRRSAAPDHYILSPAELLKRMGR